jgi:hypothetical protein
MDSAPPFGTCIWGCGRRNFNREHVVGRQIAELLDLPIPLTMHVGGFVGRSENSLRIVLKRRVCKTCNGTWMRTLDNQFVGVMKDTLRTGSRVELTSDGQESVATWATKVAMLIELFLHDFMKKNPQIEIGSTYVPSDNLSALYETRRPPDGTTVWIGAVDRESFHPFSSIGGAIFGASTSPADGIVKGELCGYQSIFNLRDVVFGVRGWASQYVRNEPRGMADPERTAPGRTIQIWPRLNENQRWPPPAGLLVEEDVKALAWTDEVPRNDSPQQR